jgi:hypothetical protein
MSLLCLLGSTPSDPSELESIDDSEMGDSPSDVVRQVNLIEIEVDVSDVTASKGLAHLDALTSEASNRLLLEYGFIGESVEQH